MKEKIIKRYYGLLIGALGLYLALSIFLFYRGVLSFEKHILPYILITFLYYLLVKNLLAQWTYRKLSHIDEKVKAEIEKRKAAQKEKLALLLGGKKREGKPKKWYYRNIIMIPLYLLLLIGLLFWLRQKGIFAF